MTIASFALNGLRKVETTPSATYIFIMDESGSIYRVSNDIRRDTLAAIKNLRPDDLVTVAWFSSEGMTGVLCKNTPASMYNTIEKLVNMHKPPFCLTCFSESLEEVEKTLTDTPNDWPVNMFFLTDGQPVVSNSKKEEERILSSCKRLSTKLSTATFVGYGDWYNRELMSRMTETAGGVFVHVEDLEKWQKTVDEFIHGDIVNRIELAIPNDAFAVFSLSSGKVVSYPIIARGKVLVAENETQVFAVTPGETQDEDDILGPRYASAALAARSGNLDAALVILSKIGDIGLVEAFANAFTTSEVGLLIAQIELCAVMPSARFANGRKKNCLPKTDAFCLIEALEVLEDDPDAKFWIDEGFDYKKIGPETKVISTLPQFHRTKGLGKPIELVWNSERLNVNIRVLHEGYIDVPDNDLGFSSPFNCVEFRNYTIIKDGTRNVNVLPMSFSEATFTKFKAGKLLKRTETYDPSRVYQLDLRRIPLMNRAMYQFVNAENVSRMKMQETTLQAFAKVANYYINLADPNGLTKISAYTPEQVEFLKEKCGIVNDNVYSPKVTSEDPTDWYECTTFEVKIRGNATIPSVNDVMKRMSSSKEMSFVSHQMARAIEEYDKMYRDGKITELREKSKSFRKQLFALRSNMARSKASVLLAGRWFSEFASRDKQDSSFNYNGLTFDFVIDKQKIAY